jgi:HK97 family phage major capsid protein
LIADGFDDEFVSKLVQERLYGTGVGQYEGITNSGSFLSVTRDGANAIVMDDILAMFARHWDTGGAMWVANKTTIPQIAALQIATAGGVSGTPAFIPSVNGSMPATLMGMPIVFTEYAKALGTPNDLMLCNWSQYLEGSIGGIEQAQSMHVRFSTMEQAFRFSARNDGKSWWKTALTPKNGDTLSPFVGLGAAS